MKKEELDKLRQPWPPVMEEAMKAMGCGLEPTYIEDEHGCYSTGFYHWKGKNIAITIDEGLWHLSAACNHTLGYYELKEIRYTFLPNDMFVAQVFPPREEFVNVSEFCFHLWQLAPGAYAEIKSNDKDNVNDNL